MKKIITLLLLFAAACGPSTESLSVLDQSSCELPCWNGIVVGKTTRDEAVKIIENLPGADGEPVRYQKENEVFDERIIFSLGRRHPLSGRASLRGEVYTKQGTVGDLILCGEIKTSIGRLVEAVGEPEHIISGNNFYGGRTVILIDSRSGISYWYTTDLDKLEITPDTPLGCIGIFGVSLYEEMLESKLFSAGYYDAAETRGAWYEWDGYGNLDEKYPPRGP